MTEPSPSTPNADTPASFALPSSVPTIHSESDSKAHSPVDVASPPHLPPGQAAPSSNKGRPALPEQVQPRRCDKLRDPLSPAPRTETYGFDEHLGRPGLSFPRTAGGGKDADPSRAHARHEVYMTWTPKGAARLVYYLFIAICTTGFIVFLTTHTVEDNTCSPPATHLQTYLQPTAAPLQPALATWASRYFVTAPDATEATRIHILTAVDDLIAPDPTPPISLSADQQASRDPSLSSLAIAGIALAIIIPMGLCGIFALSRNRYTSPHQAYPGQPHPSAQYPSYALSPQHKKTPLPYEYSVYAPPQQQLPAYHPPVQYSYYAPSQYGSYHGQPVQHQQQQQQPVQQAAMPQTVAVQPSGSYYSHAPAPQVQEPEPAKGVRFGQVAVRRYETDQ